MATNSPLHSLVDEWRRPVGELEAELRRLKGALRPLERRPRAARNVNAEHQGSLSTLERVAIWVTDRVGTMGFFLIILGWTIIWLGWNMVTPESWRFDPYPAFVLWLFISNLIQIHLMPLIMVGQNLQSRHAELRAEADFQVNQKAESEVEQILHHLEQQAQLIAHQGDLILQILHRLEAASPSPAAPQTENAATPR